MTPAHGDPRVTCCPVLEQPTKVSMVLMWVLVSALLGLLDLFDCHLAGARSRTGRPPTLIPGGKQDVHRHKHCWGRNWTRCNVQLAGELAFMGCNGWRWFATLALLIKEAEKDFWIAKMMRGKNEEGLWGGVLHREVDCIALASYSRRMAHNRALPGFTFSWATVGEGGGHGARARGARQTEGGGVTGPLMVPSHHDSAGSCHPLPPPITARGWPCRRGSPPPSPNDQEGGKNWRLSIAARSEGSEGEGRG